MQPFFGWLSRISFHLPCQLFCQVVVLNACNKRVRRIITTIRMLQRFRPLLSNTRRPCSVLKQLITTFKNDGRPSRSKAVPVIRYFSANLVSSDNVSPHDLFDAFVRHIKPPNQAIASTNRPSSIGLSKYCLGVCRIEGSGNSCPGPAGEPAEARAMTSRMGVAFERRFFYIRNEVFVK